MVNALLGVFVILWALSHMIVSLLSSHWRCKVASTEHHITVSHTNSTISPVGGGLERRTDSLTVMIKVSALFTGIGVVATKVVLHLLRGLRLSFAVRRCRDSPVEPHSLDSNLTATVRRE